MPAVGEGEGMRDDDPVLPVIPALSIMEAHLARLQGEMSWAELDDAVTLELAAHDDLAQVINAMGLMCTAVLDGMVQFAPEGVTAKGFLRGLKTQVETDHDG